MEDYEEYEEGGSSVNKILIVVVVLLLLAIAAGCVYFFFIRKEQEEDNGIGFGVGVALTQEELDAAMAEAARNASGGAVGLKYKNGAYSEDGIEFDCYIVNSESNLYDMFFEIYADEQMTDKLFTSARIPRGSGYNKLKLDRALEKGTHTVYVHVATVTEDEDGKEKLRLRSVIRWTSLSHSKSGIYWNPAFSVFNSYQERKMKS